ncbi:MAG: hypothetical protein U0637_05340 [Phycisphaerales bacterium]
MRGFQVGWIVVTTIGMIVGTAHGGIKYRVSGDPNEHDASDGTVTVGTVNGLKTVTIYDNDGTGLDTDIPALTISGTVGTNPELRVLIAPEGTQWVDQPEFAYELTAKDLAGISFGTNDNLRNVSRVVVAVAGNITGPISCGQAFRIQAFGITQSNGTVLGGNILAEGDITAYAADGFAGFNAVEVVTVGGRTLGTPAIMGDIKAAHAQGSIELIKAPLSFLGPVPGGTGLPEISARNIGSILALRVNANVTAHNELLQIATADGLFGSVTADHIPSTRTTSPINCPGESSVVIAVDGNVDGDINLFGVGAATLPLPPVTVYIGGDLNGSIGSTARIETLVVQGSICGSSSCGERQLGVSSANSIGNMVVSGRVGRADATQQSVDIVAPSIESLDIGSFNGSVYGTLDTLYRCFVGSVRVRGDFQSLEFGGVVPLPEEFFQVSRSAMFLDVACGTGSVQFDGNVEVGTSILIWQQPDQHCLSSPVPTVRIGGWLDGRVGFVEPDTLTGQVTVNASGHNGGRPGTGVRWWSNTSPVVVLQDNVDLDILQQLTPEYQLLPNSFGGGAAGEVPFRLHEQASDSYNVIDSNNELSPTVTWTEFNNEGGCAATEDIIVEFYGPVRVTDDANYPGGALLSVLLMDPLPQGGIDTELSYLMRFTINDGTPTGARQVRIDAAPGQHLPWGTYKVRNWRDGRVKPLVCADLLTTAEVPVADFEYIFKIARDCDNSCTTQGDIDCGTPFPYTLCDSVDFNNDGLYPDTTDISDFIQVFSGGACSTGMCNDIDYNNDGLFPDIMDIDALLSVFAGGPCII